MLLFAHAGHDHGNSVPIALLVVVALAVVIGTAVLIYRHEQKRHRD